MATIHDNNLSNPLLLPEIAGMIVDNVRMVSDLLSCACVNSTWSVAALKRLYNGSLNDMQFRTPDIGSLNCLFVASRERFRRNMGLVKHLLLSPESAAIEPPGTRLLCIEKCRAMRHRQTAELLLRPQGKGLTSLTIPFEIEDQDWSAISDLLLPRTIDFLAIDNSYCELLMASSNCSQELIKSTEKFLNLKALTIYKSGSFGGIDKLCRLLDSCELEFFHFEEKDEGITQHDTVELLSSLGRQKNLKALALIIESLDAIPHSSAFWHSWPRLKMLSFGVGDPHWLEQFPQFEMLQILSLKNFAPEIPMTSQKIQEIAKCRHLRVIAIDSLKLDDAAALLDIAHGCPLLQKFSVWNLDFRGKSELAENLCTGLLRALPRLEHFALGLRFRMNGASLQDLARHCPQLTILELPRARLCLSHTLLTEAHPFPQLEIMHFRDIFFKAPRLSIQWDEIRGIAADWRRTFPKLRGMPCPGDIYYDDLDEESEIDKANVDTEEEMSDLDEESAGDSARADEEPQSEPGLEYDDYGSVWAILRCKLWKVLGYPAICEEIGYLWQKNLEIETIGWPVVPLVAFCDQDNYSTSDKRYRRL